MSKPMNCPPASIVERIIREEAAAAGVEFDHVVGRGGIGEIRMARHRAIRRILAETGCSHRGLAAVWGVTMRTVTKAAKRTPPPTSHPYDKATVARLIWNYGPERTAEIVAGADLGTNRDIAAWRRACEGRAA